ncbi:hypothetical protein [Niveibacterium terrae]|uniref:hypothetical protein n=1 Tax=Niveibacterium terrae TaxID=3373598 RepID=UPI003A91C53A
MRKYWRDSLSDPTLIKGLVTVVIGDLVWAVSVGHRETYFIALLAQYMTPLFAAAVATYFDARRPIFKGIALGGAAALGAGVVSLAFEALGRDVDFHGLGGALLVATLSLPVCLLASAIGGVAGCALSHALKRSD